MLAPERRTRSDVMFALGIAVALVAAITVVWLRSDARGTTSVTAETELPPLSTSVTLPDVLTEVWSAPSAASATPVVEGNAVVTAQGGDVVGRNPASGDEVWRYSRNKDLCGILGTWDRVVTVYRDDRGCSQVTSLTGATGARKDQRNSDADPAVTLSADGTYVISRGDARMELWRSDLVRTLEFGRVDAPVNPNKQPRAGCTLLDAASSSNRVSVLEKCPDDTSNRLTLMNPAPKDAQEPEEYGSVVLPDSEGARVLAVSGEKTALYLPAGNGTVSRISIFDGTGNALVDYPIEGPVVENARVFTEKNTITWWTGTRTVNLRLGDLVPTWIVNGTSGPGTSVDGQILIPVPGGVAAVDPADGAVQRMIGVDRGSFTGPVVLTTAGDTVLEQRGDTLFALR
ncbi:hypothetical protein ABH922_002858 [Rhodococcus sp. 27YEA15]|uniref:Rv3212 family protein n=1 Tax=Rhodococcus sp. 27YEA15 TaxID=3156259 RepID=UPI003C79C44A